MKHPANAAIAKALDRNGFSNACAVASAIFEAFALYRGSLSEEVLELKLAPRATSEDVGGLVSRLVAGRWLIRAHGGALVPGPRVSRYLPA